MKKAGKKGRSEVTRKNIKKVEKFLKKVLTKRKRCDILFRHSRRASSKRSLKIEQQIRKREYERTEKLRSVSLILERNKKLLQKVKEHQRILEKR